MTCIPYAGAEAPIRRSVKITGYSQLPRDAAGRVTGPVPVPAGFREDYLDGVLIKALEQKYNVGRTSVRRWVLELKLPARHLPGSYKDKIKNGGRIVFSKKFMDTVRMAAHRKGVPVHSLVIRAVEQYIVQLDTP